MTLEVLRDGDPSQVGPYTLLARLGEGGMGVVYLARDPAGTRVAVKLLHARMDAHPDFRRRFAREVAAAKRVARFCTAPVLDADVDGRLAYLVTEYVEGPSLKQHVTTYGPLRGSALDGLAASMAMALRAIHGAGVVHRDLKPSNVLLSQVGPKVIDFGIAWLADADLSSTVLGTPAYMSPEQISGGPVGPASDIFSWGCTVAFAAAGTPPFGSGTIPTLLLRIVNDPPTLTGLPGPLHDLVLAALHKNPTARPTAQALMDHLSVGPTDGAGAPVIGTTGGGKGPSGDTDPSGTGPSSTGAGGTAGTPGTGPSNDEGAGNASTTGASVARASDASTAGTSARIAGTSDATTAGTGIAGTGGGAKGAGLAGTGGGGGGGVDVPSASAPPGAGAARGGTAEGGATGTAVNRRKVLTAMAALVVAVAGVSVALALRGDGKTTTADTSTMPPAAATAQPTPENPLRSKGPVTFYAPEEPGAAKQAALWKDDRPQDAELMRKLAQVPHAIRLAQPEVRSKVETTIAAAERAGAVPVFLVNYMPDAECRPTTTDAMRTYQEWLAGVARQIGSAKAVVILEPGSLVKMPGTDQCPDLQGSPEQRYKDLRQAVQTLKANPRTAVYLDGSQDHWPGTEIMAERLIRAGVDRTDGFFLNTAAYQSTANSVEYGKALSACIAVRLKTGGTTCPKDATVDPAAMPHFVVDTSRNGQGSWSPKKHYADPQTWCNPPGRGVGDRPTTETGEELVDAYLWIARAGTSSGRCRRGTDGEKDPERGVVSPESGEWWADLALERAKNANPPLR
ncbi:protein kinase [Nonomuraea sp. FMUSA5-5]|uniref:Protein kinase n=1 Tax=Nonomuraea composti TaxID=2720023 RepID=A0ABX1AY71_9ACTN|nr:glycoside hydrolase family 6 protein [Nonomuraea sp. FMUSA5-5]NJP89936.1 protein kinase [Nonomuraea sp. FMUSA5-5]